MLTRHNNLPLYLGLAVSLIVHVTLLPGFVTIVTADNDRQVIRARFDPEAFSKPTPEPLVLGIESEQKPSTLTWIGYEEYLEHLARLSEVEQAAFRTETTPPPSPPEVVPETPAAETAETPSESGATAGMLAELEMRLEAIHDGAGPPGTVDGTSAGGPPGPLEAILAELADAAAEAEALEAETLAAKPDEPVPPAPEAEPAPPEEPADVSDLESDPTSTVDVKWQDLQVGRPLAASGLTLKPRRPEFTLLTRLTAAPANPQVAIRFRANGVPDDARILTSSGDTRVDEAILNSLYRWRATGKRLENLAADGTFTIKMRIILSR
ncbi:MAG: energy transducer TonB family protein [Planctomycetota bacterium]|jgi:outer membrane biosynthesis protein TonB